MKNEFDRLQKVILAVPKYMQITEVINEVQKKHAELNIDSIIALKEHQLFTQTLKNLGVELFFLETDPELNEQVFTRDIGFVVDNLFCVSNLKENVRKKEKEKIIQLLDTMEFPYYEFENNIEGGDIIVHHDTIYVGLSNRTSTDAVSELKELFPNKKIIPVKLMSDILHLDCVFNILNDNYALLYRDGIVPSSFDNLRDKFSYIPINKEEQETMGTNVLCIGVNKIISLDTQTRINSQLTRRGFEVYEQPFSEIIKSGGSFRCCTLPLERIGGE